MLIAVSKTYPVEMVMEAYHAGQRHFGENRVQEVCSKYEVAPKDIHWHLIGQLQRNKVKYIVPFIYMIHSVDSVRLLDAIEAEAIKIQRKINVLLQVHIAQEETKSGFSSQELLDWLRTDLYKKYTHIQFCGLMGMATFTDDEELVRQEFRSLAQLFKKLKDLYFSTDDHFKEISMGMSGDAQIAMEEGSTMLRIGTAIFGSRSLLH